MGFNRITVVGNLGRDPELKYTPNGTAICDFSIATNTTKKSPEGDKVQSTLWFKCVAWGKLAETCSQYLTKGKETFVEGELEMEEWTDRDGAKRTNLKVVVAQMRFLSGGGNGSQKEEKPQEEKKRTPPPTPKPVEDDDIPF